MKSLKSNIKQPAWICFYKEDSIFDWEKVNGYIRSGILHQASIIGNTSFILFYDPNNKIFLITEINRGRGYCGALYSNKSLMCEDSDSFKGKGLGIESYIKTIMMTEEENKIFGLGVVIISDVEQIIKVSCEIFTKKDNEEIY